MTKMLFKAKKIKIKWCQKAFSSFRDAFQLLLCQLKGKSDIWLKKIQACMTPSLACWKCSRRLFTTSRRSQIPSYVMLVGLLCPLLFMVCQQWLDGLSYVVLSFLVLIFSLFSKKLQLNPCYCGYFNFNSYYFYF